LRESDLDLLSDAARKAGEIAVGYWSGSNRVWDKSTDDPVSEADLAVDSYLRERLTAARPDYAWLSEETEDDSERLKAARVFIVDPIDGTRAFISGEKTWAHSLAIVEDGVPVVAVVHLPLRERLFAATKGGGATLNGEAIRHSGWSGGAPIRLLSNAASMDPRHWPSGQPPVQRSFRPSLAYRLCLVAQGRYDAMVTFRDSWEWDIAAGALIAAEAGARVTNRAGDPLSFNNDRPANHGVIAAAPEAYDALIVHRKGVLPTA
jgi:myo-inositol-1(or 4)-monophosphatase